MGALAELLLVRFTLRKEAYPNPEDSKDWCVKTWACTCITCDTA